MANEVTGGGQQKAAFIRQTISTVQTLVTVIDDLRDLRKAYTDRAYGSAGANEIVQGDVDQNDILVADFTNLMTHIDDLKNFYDNVAVTAGDRQAIINEIRHSPTP